MSGIWNGVGTMFIRLSLSSFIMKESSVSFFWALAPFTFTCFLISPKFSLHYLATQLTSVITFPSSCSLSWPLHKLHPSLHSHNILFSPLVCSLIFKGENLNTKASIVHINNKEWSQQKRAKNNCDDSDRQQNIKKKKRKKDNLMRLLKAYQVTHGRQWYAVQHQSVQG